MTIEREQLGNVITKIREKQPIVFQITNTVTINDCANITLAVGASPLMSFCEEELEDILSFASSLVINIGTMDKQMRKMAVKAGQTANRMGKPVVLDPVGVGATKARKELVEDLLKNVHFAVVKGNMAEIKSIYGMENTANRGVDSVEDLENGDEIAKTLAKRYDTVIAVTVSYLLARVFCNFIAVFQILHRIYASVRCIFHSVNRFNFCHISFTTAKCTFFNKSSTSSFLAFVAPTPTGSRTTGFPILFAVCPAFTAIFLICLSIVPIFITRDEAKESISSNSSSQKDIRGEAPTAESYICTVIYCYSICYLKNYRLFFSYFCYYISKLFSFNSHLSLRLFYKIRQSFRSFSDIFFPKISDITAAPFTPVFITSCILSRCIPSE